MGEITLHGPHHVAQKSKMEGRSPLIYNRTFRMEAKTRLRSAVDTHCSHCAGIDTHDGHELGEGADGLDGHDDE